MAALYISDIGMIDLFKQLSLSLHEFQNDSAGVVSGSQSVIREDEGSENK